MKIKGISKPPTCQFIKSAVHPQDYPDPKKPEIAVAGRSNAGKSSFINALTSSKIAKVSQTPGKTRLLNFFAIGANYVLVDMPGYGFAARSGDEVTDWQTMIETYLSHRETLVGLLLIMDIRRDWDQEERMLKEFCEQVGVPMAVLLTKADKVTIAESLKAKTKIQKVSKLKMVYTISNLQPKSVREVEDLVYREWVIAAQEEEKKAKFEAKKEAKKLAEQEKSQSTLGFVIASSEEVSKKSRLNPGHLNESKRNLNWSAEEESGEDE